MEKINLPDNAKRSVSSTVYLVPVHKVRACDKSKPHNTSVFEDLDFE